MMTADEQLAAIGFARSRREPACWRTVRLEAAPAPRPAASTDPACSKGLLRWRELLARRPLPPGYRIARA